MSSSRAAVYVVDDDAAIRRSVAALVSTMDVDVFDYSSGEEFLEAYDGRRPACLVTDVRMLGMSGLELQETLNERGLSVAVVVITAYATTPMTVRAMRNGAFTFLEKPCNEDALWNAISKGLADDRKSYAEQQRRDEICARLATLTPKERRVFDCIVQGDANKVVARKLDVSIRTIESYRSRVFEKMQADSLAELVRMSVAAEG